MTERTYNGYTVEQLTRETEREYAKVAGIIIAPNTLRALLDRIATLEADNARLRGALVSIEGPATDGEEDCGDCARVCTLVRAALAAEVAK